MKNEDSKTEQPCTIQNVVGSNCSNCGFFKYEASQGYGWCHNQYSYLSGKIRGNGKSCKLNTSKQ